MEQGIRYIDKDMFWGRKATLTNDVDQVGLVYECVGVMLLPGAIKYLLSLPGDDPFSVYEFQVRWVE